MIFKGRSICQGTAKGTVVKLEEAFSFLGGVDASTGDLRVKEGNIADRIFVFPKGKGSTVGSFVMYDLMVHGKAPAAVINQSAETIVTTGAVISSIPMVDSVDTGMIMDGDIVFVNGTDGTISIENVVCKRTVSSAISVDGKILVLHRPEGISSFPGKHSLVSGKIENGETPEEAAVREIMEETQLFVDRPTASLKPMYVREKNIIWEVNVFSFILKSANPILNKENVDYEWMTPEEIKNDEKIVPKVYESIKKLGF